MNIDVSGTAVSFDPEFFPRFKHTNTSMAEDDGVLTINKAFAKNYDRYRQKEELQKLKDKYGDVSDNSSSSETEDEDAEALTDEVERDWLKAYAAVKSRDPKIYEKDVQFFRSKGDTSDTEGEGREKRKKKHQKKNSKPVTLKDYERKVILEKGGVLSDDDEEDDYEEHNVASMGYYEEQEEIKKSFQAAVETSDDSDTELLQHRKKTEEEEAADEEDYREWLKGQKSEFVESEKFGQDLIPLKQYWTDPKLEEGEKFLRDYILNKGYLEKDKERIPTYQEIVDGADFSEEEEILQKQEEFETKYNFRYEEPDEDFIKRYPRTISESVRRAENKRSKKRSEVKERKELEKQKKREELKQLKNLKKKEILDKMDRLKEITGNTSLGFSEQDLEGDFDPEKYDRLMQNVFNEDYYGDGEDTKPVFPEDDDLDLEGDWDNWQGADNFGEYHNDEDRYSGETGPHCEDPDFNMDADYDPDAVPEKKLGKKQGKKKSKFAEAIFRTKPVFDPKERSFEKYFEEYYKLDYEDIIGDLPCRFKYRKTVPNNYGLSVQEIMSAEDKELNAWCSVKKMSQYRGEQEENADIKKYRRKAQKKYNVLTSLKPTVVPTSTIANDSTVSSGTDVQTDTFSRKAKKKKRQVENVTSEDWNRNAGVVKADTAEGGGESTVLEVNSTSSPRKKKKHSEKIQAEDLSESPIKAMRHKDVVDEYKQTKDSNQSNSRHEKMIKNASRKKNNTDKNRKRKKKKHKPVISDERLKAYGINPKKFKQIKKHSLTSS